MGTAELLMPSFEEVMNKTILSFEKIMPELFQEFSKQEECGNSIMQKKCYIGLWIRR